MRRSPWTTLVGIVVFILALVVAWWLVGVLFSVAWFIVKAVFAIVVALILAGIAAYLVSRARSGD
jgi:multisubunit Na+/H+ antiporter MnhG subunit